MSEYRRCTGGCCQGFGLPKPEFLAEKVNKIENGDGPMLMRMLIPRGPSAIEDSDRWVYDCRHFDAANGQCRVYDIRPTMCRDYPGYSDCRIDGCTLVSVEGLARRVKPLNICSEDIKDVEVLKPK